MFFFRVFSERNYDLSVLKCKKIIFIMQNALLIILRTVLFFFFFRREKKYRKSLKINVNCYCLLVSHDYPCISCSHLIIFNCRVFFMFICRKKNMPVIRCYLIMSVFSKIKIDALKIVSIIRLCFDFTRKN